MAQTADPVRGCHSESGWGPSAASGTSPPDAEGPCTTCDQHQPVMLVFMGGNHKKGYLLPGDFQVQFDGAEVIDVNGHHLRFGCKQLFGLAGHAAHQEVGRQPFDLCDLRREREGMALGVSGGSR